MNDLDTSFEVGIEHIDEAHRCLFELMSKAEDLIHDPYLREDKKLKSARYILNRLLDYTVTHFVEEEYIMELHHVPGRLAHKKAHRKLEKVLIDLYKTFSQEGMVILPDIIALLKSWWTNHILEIDKKDLANIPDHIHEEKEDHQAM